MAKAILALYDSEQGYVDRFVSYLRKKTDFPYEIKGFTEEEALREYLEFTHVRVLLYSAEYPIGKTGKDENTERFLGHRNVDDFICLGEKKKSGSRVKHINKYQSMEKIVLDVLGLIGDERGEENGEEELQAEIIGFYSPMEWDAVRDGALQLAEDLSEDRKVLYINLERFSGLRKKLGVGTENSISDFIYFFRTNEMKFREAIQKNTAARNGFDIITGPVNMEDMNELKDKEWTVFLNRVAALGGYQAVVLDMAEAFMNLKKAFEFCRTVYVPVGTGHRAAERINEMKQYFEERDDKEIRKKLKYIRIRE